jgi:hypothetical protein
MNFGIRKKKRTMTKEYASDIIMNSKKIIKTIQNN